MRLNQSHMKYIHVALKSQPRSLPDLNPTPVFLLTYSKTKIVLLALNLAQRSTVPVKGQIRTAKCDSLSLPPRHGSLEFRWRRWMLGYIRGRRELAARSVLGLLLLLLVPAHGRAQTLKPPPIDRPKDARVKAKKKRLPERTFVLVGAGDIASCKNPEGARATAKLIEQIPGTVFAAGDLAYENGSAEDFKNCYDRPGAASKTGPNRLLGIMSMSIVRRWAISNTGERRQGHLARATIATT